jgi:DNA-binding MarR family transcriptional regulator
MMRLTSWSLLRRGERMGKRLKGTVGDHVLVHLGNHRRHNEGFVMPVAMTQSGLADALGISRAHAAVELKRLVAAGKVTTDIRHVTGQANRKKVYMLTEQSLPEFRSLRKVINQMPVAPRRNQREVMNAIEQQQKELLRRSTKLERMIEELRAEV